MSTPGFTIIPYHPRYETALEALEKESPQGTWIQLVLEKDSFISRSKVFDDYAVYLAIGPNDNLLAVYAAAIVPIRVDDATLSAGILYDARVASAYRNQGIAKTMLRYVREHYLRPKRQSHIISTMKSSNKAILRISEILNTKIYRYPFSYLTISTRRRIKHRPSGGKRPLFIPTLFEKSHRLQPYYTLMENRPGIWNTHAMYRVKIHRVHPLVKWGVHALGRLPLDMRIPRAGDTLRFAMLFDTEVADAESVNSILDTLQNQGVDFLSVCCQKSDRLYRLLRPIALNAYPYLLLSTYPVEAHDNVFIDVRCL